MYLFYTYRVIPSGEYSWGVECVETADRVENICGNFHEAERLALRFTAQQLSPIHLQDATDDFDHRPSRD